MIQHPNYNSFLHQNQLVIFTKSIHKSLVFLGETEMSLSI